MTPRDLHEARPPHTSKGLRNVHKRSPTTMSMKTWARTLSKVGVEPLKTLARQWLKRKGMRQP